MLGVLRRLRIRCHRKPPKIGAAERTDIPDIGSAPMSIEPIPPPAEGPCIETRSYGYELLNDPLLNKGTAFTEQERDDFDLHGLLPPTVTSLDEQVGRRLQALRQMPNDLARYVFLRG